MAAGTLSRTWHGAGPTRQPVRNDFVRCFFFFFFFFFFFLRVVFCWASLGLVYVQSACAQHARLAVLLVDLCLIELILLDISTASARVFAQKGEREVILSHDPRLSPRFCLFLSACVCLLVSVCLRYRMAKPLLSRCSSNNPRPRHPPLAELKWCLMRSFRTICRTTTTLSTTGPTTSFTLPCPPSLRTETPRRTSTTFWCDRAVWRLGCGVI